VTQQQQPPSILPPNTHRAAAGSSTSAVFVTPDEKDQGIDPLLVAQKVAQAAAGPAVSHGHALGQRGISVQMVGGGGQALHVQAATVTQQGDPAAAAPGQVMPLLKPTREPAAIGAPQNVRVVEPAVANPLQGLQVVRLYGNDAMLCCQLMQSYAALREVRADGSVVLFDPFSSPMPRDARALFADVPGLIVERLIEQGLLSLDAVTSPDAVIADDPVALPAGEATAIAVPPPNAFPFRQPFRSPSIADPNRVPARMTRNDKGEVVREPVPVTQAEALQAAGVTTAVELTRAALAQPLAEPLTPEPEKQVAPLQGGGGGETTHENVTHNPTAATLSFAAPAGPPLRVHIRGTVQIYSPSHVKVSHERDPGTGEDFVTVEPSE